MVETIDPVVHGGRNRSYRSAVLLHALGATMSAALVGAVLATAGWAVGAPWGRAGPIVVIVVAVVYLLREALRLPVPLFDRRRQVPEWWRTFYSARTAAFLYGVGLGAGYFTYLTYGTFVVVSAAALVSGNPLLGALLTGPFGLARGLSVMVGRGRGTEDLMEALDRAAQGSWVRSANALVLALLVAAAVAALATGSSVS
jgi:Na+-driven multidrug efflux pump